MWTRERWAAPVCTWFLLLCAFSDSCSASSATLSWGWGMVEIEDRLSQITSKKNAFFCSFFVAEVCINITIAEKRVKSLEGPEMNLF